MERFSKLLLETMDVTMRQVFGESASELIYRLVERHLSLKREEIAEKPEVFSAGLKRLLSSGAPVIEKMILKNLYSKLGLEFAEKEDYGFSDYIKQLKKWKNGNRKKLASQKHRYHKVIEKTIVGRRVV